MILFSKSEVRMQPPRMLRGSGRNVSKGISFAHLFSQGHDHVDFVHLRGLYRRAGRGYGEGEGEDGSVMHCVN